MKAPDAIDTLKKLIETARSRSAPGGRRRPLSILPGSGLNPTTLPDVLQELCPSPFELGEVHCSCGGWEKYPSFVGANVSSAPTQVDSNFGGPSSRPDPAEFGFGGGAVGETHIWATSSRKVAEVRQLLDNFAAE